ncbi:hypothetical protein EX30DRAFT_338327 [Ascodesmis nigricans]|uniref:Uncharacterized protein n=1 Tax=Ascodesmis nigricans TaxID=341454 RepID=A0A4S2N3P7_9PEZI|nr:hypothetical protein EX30DRAFT_338327 [Ascodesmis nigricans]
MGALGLTAFELAKLFVNGKDIKDIVGDIDFSKMDLRTATRGDHVTSKLAPSKSEGMSDIIKKLDEDLQIMIAGTTKEIAKIPGEERTWKRVVGTMENNPLIESYDEDVDRNDIYTNKGINVFKIDGSPDDSIVRDVMTWFTKLVKDQDILDATAIDIKSLANIVAQSGATIEDAPTFVYKNEQHEQTLLDIGVLRYPDIDRPYFKLYRIELTAWSKSERFVFVQNDENGITGVFNMRKYRPRKSVMEGLTKETRKKAIEQANSMFDD